jgi:3-oxoacid CoA-transferase subunit B
VKQGLTRELIALRIAQELEDGTYVNLGFGIPTLVANFIPRDIDVVLHSEQGVLGYHGVLSEQDGDIDLINASGQPTSVVRGACFCDFATSFGMIRGGHLDISVLGAYQVSEKGDLANWQIPGQKIGGIGGGMDLAFGVKRVIVAMEHTAKTGQPRIVEECTFPLTAKGVVKTIVTNLAYIDVMPAGLVLKELAVTEPRLIISDKLTEMSL